LDEFDNYDNIEQFNKIDKDLYLYFYIFIIVVLLLVLIDIFYDIYLEKKYRYNLE